MCVCAVRPQRVNTEWLVCVCSYEAHVSDQVEQHDSIQEVKSAIQQPPYCTLEDCFQLYTRDERVSTLALSVEPWPYFPSSAGIWLGIQVLSTLGTFFNE